LRRLVIAVTGGFFVSISIHAIVPNAINSIVAIIPKMFTSPHAMMNNGIPMITASFEISRTSLSLPSLLFAD
jgi:hypothetical protein